MDLARDSPLEPPSDDRPIKTLASAKSGPAPELVSLSPCTIAVSIGSLAVIITCQDVREIVGGGQMPRYRDTGPDYG
jgi:hypothetical protein